MNLLEAAVAELKEKMNQQRITQLAAQEMEERLHRIDEKVNRVCETLSPAPQAVS